MRGQHPSEIPAQGFSYRPGQGYLIVDHDGTGMLEVQRDDSKNIFPDDGEAARRAALDGVPIIPPKDLPHNFPLRYFGWINTPDNRARIEAYTANLEHGEELRRLTDKNWRNLSPADCCGEAAYCDRECRYNPEHAEQCDTLKRYRRLAEYEDVGLEPAEVALAVAALMGRELAQIVEFNDVPLDRLIELAKAEKDNGPLTLEQLQTMAGQPVWCAEENCWGIIKLETIGTWAGQPFLVGASHYGGGAVNFELDIAKRGYTLYRHKPEGGKDNA